MPRQRVCAVGLVPPFSAARRQSRHGQEPLLGVRRGGCQGARARENRARSSRARRRPALID
eukprot:5340324-Prymnesium_polylepis.2